MSFAVSYLALQTPEPEPVYSELHVAPTGAREEIPEAPILGARLPNGWTLIFCNRTYHRFVRPAALARLSQQGEVVACEVDERSGVSSARRWKNGRETWAVSSEPGTTPERLTTRGKLPSQLVSILERLHQAQQESPETDHLFEIPIECFRSLTGFHYNYDLPGGESRPYEVLVELGLEGEPYPDLRLEVEDEPVAEAPSLERLHTAVDWLTARGGPGFLVLEGHGDDYTQAAGGDGVYTAEWREYTGEDFRHWVAGKPGVTLPGEVAVATNGFHVKVRRNERLSAEDVQAILTAYAQGDPRPRKFLWRDVTARFTRRSSG